MLLTNDKENRDKARDDGIKAYTGMNAKIFKTRKSLNIVFFYAAFCNSEFIKYEISFVVEEYVQSIVKFPDLLDKLAQLDQDRTHAVSKFY